MAVIKREQRVVGQGIHHFPNFGIPLIFGTFVGRDAPPTHFTASIPLAVLDYGIRHERAVGTAFGILVLSTLEILDLRSDDGTVEPPLRPRS